MHIDGWIALAGLIVGFVVGMTGMGGGALMTPILVLLFNVAAPAAVASDLVAAVVMKPVGSAVHLRRGTVNKELVKWLVIGSVPFAFSGVFILKSLGDAKRVAADTKLLLGYALLLAATTMCIKAFLQLRGYKRDRELIAAGHIPPPPKPLVVRPIPTILVGALGGLVVGMTSVGSGSLIIVTLLLLYPSLKANQLVGTDLVQAVPLVGAAALGHILYGDFQLALTTSLLIGSIPGCYLGAKVSSSAPQGLIRRALVLVLVASGLKLFNVSNADLGLTLLAGAILGPITWAAIRHFNGFTWRYRPALPETEQNPSEATAA